MIDPAAVQAIIAEVLPKAQALHRLSNLVCDNLGGVTAADLVVAPDTDKGVGRFAIVWPKLELVRAALRAVDWDACHAILSMPDSPPSSAQDPT